MGDVERAALIFAGFTLAFVLLALLVWRRRRPATAGAPAVTRYQSEKAPRFARKAAREETPVDIAPARLARISGRTMAEAPDEPAAAEAPAETPGTLDDDAIPADPAALEARLDAMASDVTERAHGLEPSDSDVADIRPADTGAPPRGVRLVPRIPPRDAILAHSWIGGRPRLPAAMDWPRVDGVHGDFIAQVACTDLPRDLWDGLGPRSGWIAIFAHPDSGAPLALHLTEDGPQRDAPRPVGPAWFAPSGARRIGELAHLTVRAFPQWVVDVVETDGGDTDGGDEASPVDDLHAAGYDIADPAFHPFDWDSMTALADVLENRLARLPIDPSPPADASDELAEAIAGAAAINADARERAAEIIAIIRDSAAEAGGFTPADATAVLAALHAIRWTAVLTEADPETGEDRVEMLTLPLTRHHPDADLWVHDYQTILFDRAKHAWCANPDALSAPARGLYEPLWRAMAAHEAATMGGRPAHPVAGYDEDLELILLRLPSSGLMSRFARDGGDILLTMRKADLAAGDFSRLRARIADR